MKQLDPIPNPQSALCLRLMRVCSELSAAGDACLSGTGLNQTRFAILYHLAQAPEGLNPKELAVRLAVPRATMTGLLDGLEKEGHTERGPDPSDRRALRVRLTTSGTKFVKATVPSHCRRISRIMEALSEKERVLLGTVLDKIETAVDSMEGQP